LSTNKLFLVYINEQTLYGVLDICDVKDVCELIPPSFYESRGKFSETLYGVLDICDVKDVCELIPLSSYESGGKFSETTYGFLQKDVSYSPGIYGIGASAN
jgi:hypothetical protein